MRLGIKIRYKHQVYRLWKEEHSEETGFIYHFITDTGNREVKFDNFEFKALHSNREIEIIK
jgi:hypothetical protein